MRRLTALLLAAAMLLALSACGGTAEAPAESAAASSAEQAASAPAAPQAETPEAAPSAVPEESALEVPAEPEPEPEPTPEPNGPTIVSVTCRDTLVETAATDSDWINSPSASSNIDAVTLSDGTVLDGAQLSLGSSGIKAYPVTLYWSLSFCCPLDPDAVRSLSLFGDTVDFAE